MVDLRVSHQNLFHQLESFLERPERLYSREPGRLYPCAMVIILFVIFLACYERYFQTPFYK